MPDEKKKPFSLIRTFVLADVITFGYGNIEPDRLTSEQRADLRVMLDTAEQGRSDVLPNANRAEGIAAYDRFRASLDC